MSGSTVPMTAARMAGLYALFAALSIAMNLGSQWASNRLYAGPYHIALSMLVGTAVGLLVKYVLDKLWIFRFRPANASHEARTFVLYTLMGGATTLVFWGTEALFQWIWGSEVMRYLGALIGLIAGYAIKYVLDRKWVFVDGR